MDEAVPGSPFDEGVVGLAMDGTRVRAYPASYAEYQIVVRGARGEINQSGVLGHDGCIPDAEAVPGEFLSYADAAGPYEPGGIQLHMTLTGRIEVGLGSGSVLDIQEGGSTVSYSFGTFTAFDEEPHAWALDGGYRVPPDVLVLADGDYSHATTVAATLSNSAKRMVEEGIELDAGSYSVVVGAGVTGAYGSKDYRCEEIGDSYFDGVTLHIGQAFFPCEEASRCDASASTECRRPCAADADCTGGQSCMETTADTPNIPQVECQGIDCFCAWPPQGAFKYVTTHELGHLVQSQTAGSLSAARYAYECPENHPRLVAQGFSVDCKFWGKTVFIGGTEVLEDPPGMNPSCGCGHVEYGNGLHCLQSIETTSDAQGEGFAQYYSSLMWNPSAGTCLFNYYKEVLDESCRVSDSGDCTTFQGLTSTSPPVPIDCGEAVRWRNRQQCTVGAGSGGKPASGTEWDWMTFLRDLDNSFTFGEVMAIYRAACDVSSTPATDPALLPKCSSETISWEDTATSVGFLSGAARRYGLLSSEEIAVSTAGAVHGVGSDVSP